MREGGLSASEKWIQRDVFTCAQLPLDDNKIIADKSGNRQKQHLPSARYKSRGAVFRQPAVAIGDVVYLVQDRKKTKCRDKYLVMGIENGRYQIQKFIGNQIRNKQYIVSGEDVIKVLQHKFPTTVIPHSSDDDDDELQPQGAVDSPDIQVEQPDVHVSADEQSTHELSHSESDYSDSVDELRRSDRRRQPPQRLGSYYTGKRLSEVVPLRDQ